MNFSVFDIIWIGSLFAWKTVTVVLLIVVVAALYWKTFRFHKQAAAATGALLVAHLINVAFFWSYR